MITPSANWQWSTWRTYHSDIVRQKRLLRLYQPLMRRFLGSMNAIVATSPNHLASSEVLKRYRDKTRMIAYGLDKSIYPEPRRDRLAYWRARIGQRFFLFVGVLRYYKGLHILLEAAAGADNPVVIVGAGPIEAELKAHADPRAFGNAMRRLWDDPALARAMGQRAEARYWNLFTAAQMAHRYCALYSELAAGNEPSVHTRTGWPENEGLPRAL